MRSHAGGAGPSAVGGQFDSRPGAGSDLAIESRGLCMRYGSVEAVRGLDLEVRRGEVFAFLGPNGAGKTTTVEILEGFRRRSGGHVRVLGDDPAEAGGSWRARIGVVLQESQPDPGLTVREAVELYAGYYSNPRGVEETLALVGLTENAELLGTALSGGQRRRLDVALALVGQPELLFLDEPTTGFDPAARRLAWKMIEGLRAIGTTIFLTTHAMDEAAYLADRIAVIADGRIIASGTPATIGGRAEALSTISFTLPSNVAEASLPLQLREGAVFDLNGSVSLQTQAPLLVLELLAQWSRQTDVQPAALEVRQPSLEDVYLSLTHAAEVQ
jgi:ABC-2 type transport system ATP-binding protein